MYVLLYMHKKYIGWSLWNRVRFLAYQYTDDNFLPRKDTLQILGYKQITKIFWVTISGKIVITRYPYTEVWIFFV